MLVNGRALQSLSNAGSTCLPWAGGPVMFNGLDYGDSDEFDEEEEHVSVGYGTVVANNEVDDLSDLSDLDETDL